MPPIVFFVVGGIFWTVAILGTLASVRSTQVRRKVELEMELNWENEEVNGVCLRKRK